MRILWIDDHPAGVRQERRILEGRGVEVTMAESSQRAFEALDRAHFDLLLSDVDRHGTPDEGIRVLPALRSLSGGAPVIYYVRRLDPDLRLPAGAFGITDDPEELLHLVLEVGERR